MYLVLLGQSHVEDNGKETLHGFLVNILPFLYFLVSSTLVCIGNNHVPQKVGIE